MPLKKTTVLTADDDPHLLRLVMRNLELEGYEVLTASDGQQALEQIKAHTPDLVLLDVMMPKMDGFTVCQQVRAFSAVPIIMVTARGQEQDKVHGLNLGADDYLTKPFGVDELLARVRAVLHPRLSGPKCRSCCHPGLIVRACLGCRVHGGKSHSPGEREPPPAQAGA